MERRRGIRLTWTPVALDHAGFPLKEHDAYLLAPEHDAAPCAVRVLLVLVCAILAAVGALEAQARHDAREEGVEHPRAVAHVVVEVVPGEAEGIAREEAERAVCRREDEELCGERYDLQFYQWGLEKGERRGP